MLFIWLFFLPETSKERMMGACYIILLEVEGKRINKGTDVHCP